VKQSPHYSSATVVLTSGTKNVLESPYVGGDIRSLSTIVWAYVIQCSLLLRVAWLVGGLVYFRLDYLLTIQCPAIVVAEREAQEIISRSSLNPESFDLSGDLKVSLN